MLYCTGQLHESLGATELLQCFECNYIYRALAKIMCKNEHMSFGTYRKGEESSEALQNVQMWM